MGIFTKINDLIIKKKDKLYKKYEINIIYLYELTDLEQRVKIISNGKKVFTTNLKGELK